MTTKEREKIEKQKPTKKIRKQKIDGDLKYIPTKEQDNKLREYTNVGDQLRTVWVDWFLGERVEAKSRIAYEIDQDIELRSAMQSALYDLWKEETGSNISFEDFLNTDITLYRGVTQRNLEKGETGEQGFNTFTLRKDQAEKFGGKRGVQEVIKKPRDLYGASRS